MLVLFCNLNLHALLPQTKKLLCSVGRCLKIMHTYAIEMDSYPQESQICWMISLVLCPKTRELNCSSGPSECLVLHKQTRLQNISRDPLKLHAAALQSDLFSPLQNTIC